MDGDAVSFLQLSRVAGVGSPIQDQIDAANAQISTNTAAISTVNASYIPKSVVFFSELSKNAADAAASTATAEHTLHQFVDGCTIYNFAFIPDAALTADNTNFATFFLYRRDADASNKTTLATNTTKIAGGTGNWTARNRVLIQDLNPAIGVANVTLNQIVSIEITKSGSGVVIPAGLFVVQYLIV